jgi:toxin-antitoxin system PIN domain toxin
VIVVDANVLLYAYNPASEHHAACRRWLEDALNGSEQVGLPWQSVLAFLRIATNPRVFTRPLRAAEASAIVDQWFERPQALIVEPDAGYWSELKQQIDAAQATGPLVSDAALATLALQYGARLCTTDRDFTRFRGLQAIDPR